MAKWADFTWEAVDGGEAEVHTTERRTGGRPWYRRRRAAGSRGMGLFLAAVGLELGAEEVIDFLVGHAGRGGLLVDGGHDVFNRGAGDDVFDDVGGEL